MSEAVLRLVIFLAIFVAMAAFELLVPRRALSLARARRWPTNLAIVLIDTLVLRVVFPLAAVGAAIWAQERGWGLFPALGLPPVVAGILVFLILDFSIWLAHVIAHKVPLLWRVHRMHHADLDVDVTTALRFHPIEILLSMVWKAAIVIALGAPPTAVLIFEAVLNGCAMFNHSNLKLSPRLDAIVRLIVVTPDMHRVHHSVLGRETDSNYGFNLPFWDRIFGTYVPQPQAGHEAMELGLEEFRDTSPAGLIWSLLLPIRRPGPQKRAASSAVADEVDRPQ